MKVDVTKLKTYQVSKIEINEEVDLSSYLLKDYRVSDIKNVLVNGKISLNENDELELIAKLTGTMILKDDITLEPVDYSFDVDVEEIIEDNQFIIDITDILWQNILTEIPSKVRKTNEDIELSGDGWRVISEDKYMEERNTRNNPFANLGELLKTKEDK